MNTASIKKKPSFLKGGGEMGQLIRNYDWEKTELGPPESWPEGLKLTLSMILQSKFPMFLWWGENLLQFYNDAYRPSLGNNGKHPKALGQHGVECWPEIWPIIFPLITQVRETAEATWSEDQLIPIYRNGKIEDVYWTFGYSPVYADTNDEKVAGVLVVCHETTEKILAGQALEKSRNSLEESERRFRTMSEATSVLIAVSDETSKATYFNRAWFEFTGRSLNELAEFGWADLIHEEDRKEFVDHYLQSFKEQKDWIGEFRILNKENKYRWLYAIGTARKSPGGTFGGYVSSSIDITEKREQEDIRNEVEKKIKKSEAKLRSIIDAAPPAIGLFEGPDLIVRMPNKSFIEVVGKGPDIEGKPLREVMPELEEEGQPFLKILQDVYTTGKMFKNDASQVTIVRNGMRTENYYNITYSPLYDAEGQIFGVLDVALDVTGEVNAKKRIIQSEQNLRNIILQAPVAMALLKGKEFICEIANERMFELWGKKSEEMLGRQLFVGLPEAKNQGFEELLNKVFTTGKTYSALGVPVNLPRKETIETIYINFVYEPYKDLDGEITGIMALAFDVSAQLKAKQEIDELVDIRTQELARANENLTKSNLELEQFAYIASHDLQEPLRKISTYSNLLKTSENQLPEKSKTYLEKIVVSTNRMHALIKDVLSYSAVGNIKENSERVDLNVVISKLKSDFELLIEQKNALVEYKELPVIRGIPQQMSQLFGNLLSNALKFTKPDSQPVIRVASSTLSETELAKNPQLTPGVGYYKIEFTDNGIGFDEVYAMKIFNIFQRLHRKSEFEGTGIGLAMCKKIVENHHGDIKATSDGKNGTTFTIILPA